MSALSRGSVVCSSSWPAGWEAAWAQARKHDRPHSTPKRPFRQTVIAIVTFIERVFGSGGGNRFTAVTAQPRTVLDDGLLIGTPDDTPVRVSKGNPRPASISVYVSCSGEFCDLRQQWLYPPVVRPAGNQRAHATATRSVGQPQARAPRDCLKMDGEWSTTRMKEEQHG